MVRYLRFIKASRWFSPPHASWPPPGEVQARALQDLQLRRNSLSVFRVVAEAEIELVVLALAAGRQSLDLADYVLMDESELASRGIELCKTEGETPDCRANDLHYNMFNLTISSVYQISCVIHAVGSKRIHRRDIKSGLEKSLQNGSLDAERVSQGILAKLENQN